MVVKAIDWALEAGYGDELGAITLDELCYAFKTCFTRLTGWTLQPQVCFWNTFLDEQLLFIFKFIF